MARITANDHKALKDLLERYGERIFRYALRLTGEEQIAEEVANDVALEIWRYASRFSGNSKVSTWILGIARHKALNAVRGKKIVDFRDTTVFDRVDESYKLGTNLNISAHKGLKLVLRDALQKLSVEHRDVVELTFYLDCSYTEVAHIVGCPVATVRTRMFYAKRILRQALSNADATVFEHLSEME